MATEVPGNFITAALWNAQVAALGNFTLSVPRFRGYQTTVQFLLDSTWVSLAIDTEDFDSDGGHSTTTNTSRYVCQVAGTYWLAGMAGFAGNATGNRAARLAVNGTAIHGTFVKVTAASTSTVGVPTFGYAALAVGDYVEVQATQNSGVVSPGLSTASSTDIASALAVHFISS
jgi:hypothetical protein